MSLTLITAPPAYPVTVAEVKAHLRIDGTDEDTLLTALIAAATAHLDGRDGTLGRCLVRQSWDMKIDAFPCGSRLNPYGAIRLPLPPVVSVDFIKYIDQNGTLTTLDSAIYTVDLGGAWPGKVTPAYGQVWPAVQDVPDAVTVRFTAGYEPGAGSPTDYAESVPAPLKAALKLLVAHWFENRTPVNVGNIVNDLPMTVKALLAPYQVAYFA